MSNPLVTILEMLFFLFKSLIEALFFILTKTIEFIASISSFSLSSIENAILSALVGGLLIFFVFKYVLGITKELLIIIIIYVILILALFIYRFIS